MKSQRSIRNTAMDLLSRREHSAAELMQKLKQRRHDEDEIAAVIATLQADNLQSNERFAESFINQRVNAGFGPIKIRHELRQKEVDDELVELILDAYAGEWQNNMVRLRIRKYGEEIPPDYVQKMKQARFLQNRGFSSELVNRLFR